jgi:hypothetical protein
LGELASLGLTLVVATVLRAGRRLRHGSPARYDTLADDGRPGLGIVAGFMSLFPGEQATRRRGSCQGAQPARRAAWEALSKEEMR